MRFCRCLVGAVAIALTAASSLLVVAPSVAMAQADGGSLDENLIRSAAPLSRSQQQQVERFVKQQVDRMISAVKNEQHAQLSDARRKLLSPLKAAYATQDFREVMVREVAEQIIRTQRDEKGDPQPPMLRLNGMIVVANLSDGRALPLARQGLDDQSPFVRYWAAQAVANYVKPTIAPLADRPPLSDRLQQDVLEMLTPRLTAEPDELVFKPLGQAVLDLSIAESNSVLIDALNERAQRYADDADRAVHLAVDILQGEALKLVNVLPGAGSRLNEQQQQLVKGIVKVAAKYMQVVSNRLMAPNAGQMVEVDKRELETSLLPLHQILKVGVNMLQFTGKIPDPPRRIAPVPAVAAVNAMNWVNILAGPPINIPREQLEVQFPS